MLLLAGRNEKTVSALRPLAKESASSILVSRALAVFQVWVRVRPVARCVISNMNSNVICPLKAMNAKPRPGSYLRRRGNISTGPNTPPNSDGGCFETFRSFGPLMKEVEVPLPSDLSEYLPSSYIPPPPSLARYSSKCPFVGGKVQRPPTPTKDRAQTGAQRKTYSTAGGLFVAALASDLESNIVGSVALDLDGASREMVEVLVQQLSTGMISRAAFTNGCCEGNSAIGKQIAQCLGVGGVRLSGRDRRTSLADLEISAKAGTDMMGDVCSGDYDQRHGRLRRRGNGELKRRGGIGACDVVEVGGLSMGR